MLKRSMTLNITYNICMILNNKIMAQYWWILIGSSSFDRHDIKYNSLTLIEFLEIFFKNIFETN